MFAIHEPCEKCGTEGIVGLVGGSVGSREFELVVCIECWDNLPGVDYRLQYATVDELDASS